MVFIQENFGVACPKRRWSMRKRLCTPLTGRQISKLQTTLKVFNTPHPSVGQMHCWEHKGKCLKGGMYKSPECPAAPHRNKTGHGSFEAGSKAFLHSVPGKKECKGQQGGKLHRILSTPQGGGQQVIQELESTGSLTTGQRMKVLPAKSL